MGYAQPRQAHWVAAPGGGWEAGVGEWGAHNISLPQDPTRPAPFTARALL